MLYDQGTPSSDQLKQIRKGINEQNKSIFKNYGDDLLKDCTDKIRRRWEEKISNGAGRWLHALPNKRNNALNIPKKSFKDALKL